MRPQWFFGLQPPGRVDFSSRIFEEAAGGAWWQLKCWGLGEGSGGVFAGAVEEVAKKSQNFRNCGRWTGHPGRFRKRSPLTISTTTKIKYTP
jgi:hypothetical protein